MLNRCDSVLDAIGRTPIIRLHHVTKGLAPEIYAKIEFVNPGGSVKDRVALAMIEAAEQDGSLSPGGTIIEATSGNTGVGLAMVAAVKGYRCIFIMPDKMSTEKIRLLKAYGAEVVLTPSSAESNSSEGYSGVAARLANEIPNAFQPNQFANLNNPDYHYRATGPEIWEQTAGRITCFVSGIGTGGTISGVGRFLKEKDPNIKIVAGDPEGSILSGDRPKPWAVEGIGEDYVPKTLNSQVVDEWVRVSDADSFSIARSMARHEGLLVGGSCGTAMMAGLHYAKRLGSEDLMVVMCPDTGRNYLSKMYSDEWMIEQGFMKPSTKPFCAGELLEQRGATALVSLRPEQTAADAIAMFREHEISQLPVIEDGKVVGGIRELTVARLLHARMDPRQVAVQDLMARPLPCVEAKTDLDEVYRLLSAGNTGVVVLKQGEIAGIITRIDLINFWDAPMEAAQAGANA